MGSPWKGPVLGLFLLAAGPGLASESGSGPPPPPPAAPMSTAARIGMGAFALALVEGGVIIHSAAFAANPVGGSVVAGAAGLLAAMNSSGSKGARTTLYVAGSLIAYNLIRFGPETEMSESRSVRIFTENMILMHAGLIAGFALGEWRERRDAGKPEAPLSVRISPDRVALNRTWRF